MFLSCAHVSVEHAEVVSDVWVFLHSHGIDATVDRGPAYQPPGLGTVDGRLRWRGRGPSHHALPVPPYIRDSAELLDLCYSRGKSILIEGTQGTGLSVLHGSFPHVTSRDTTVSALLSEVGIAPQRLRRTIVAFRVYPIRVSGKSGPMGKELTWETIAERAGMDGHNLSVVEVGSVSGGVRRVAEFSWTQLKRSANLNGATDIALTFVDYMDFANKAACRFDQLTRETILFVEEVEFVAGAPVSLISARFDGRGLIDRRQW